MKFQIIIILMLAGYALSGIFYSIHLASSKRILLYLGRGFLYEAFCLHTLHILLLNINHGHIGVFGFSESRSLFAWLLVLGFFWVNRKFKFQILGCLIPPPGVFLWPFLSCFLFGGDRTRCDKTIAIRLVSHSYIRCFCGRGSICSYCALGFFILNSRTTIKIAKTWIFLQSNTFS